MISSELLHIYENAKELLIVSGKPITETLTSKYFVRDNLAGKSFNIGAFTLQIVSVNNIKCHIIEHINGVVYEHHNRTYDILFDFVNEKLKTYRAIVDRHLSNSANNYASSTFKMQLASEDRARIDLIDLICHHIPIQFDERCIAIHNNRIELAAFDAVCTIIPGTIIKQPEITVSMDRHVTSSNRDAHAVVFALSSIPVLQEISKEFHRYQKLSTQLEKLRQTNCTIDVFLQESLSSEIQQFMISNDQEIIKVLPSVKSYSTITFRLSKPSTKAYLVEVYEEYEDGRKYWNFYHKRTGVVKNVDEFIRFVDTVYSTFA